jgi:hypothetical protein
LDRTGLHRIPIQRRASPAKERARTIVCPDVLDLIELDVIDLAVAVFRAAIVNGLNDVPGLRVDHDWTARALELQAFHCRNHFVAVGVAISFLERRIDCRHAVIAGNRHEVGAQFEAVRLAIRLHVGLVHR